ncbi:MAG: hypothetical protein Q8O46_00990 [bacterium]|nr:hypothetical protein [bacterium]
MTLPEGDNLGKIEELKRKLFSKSYRMKIEHRDNFSEITPKDVPDAWEGGSIKPGWGDRLFIKTSVFKKFFIFSIVFFVLALSYASYVFFAKENTVSNKNIDIAILGNTFTAGGEELSLVVEITNKNSLPLNSVELVVEYPKGSIGDLLQDSERIRETLGTISSGTVFSKNIKIVLFGEQGSIRPIRISIEYKMEGSNAVFVKEKLYEISINSTPLNISITGPKSASPNQIITLDVKSSLNATKALAKVLMKIDYPTGFQFTSANPAPAFGNNIWNLGDLSPGSEQEISITGKMLDVFDGEEKTFRVWSGSQSSSDKSVIDLVFSSVFHTLAIKKPLITAELFINGIHQREYAVSSKTTVTGEIRWVNNLETKINDFVISAWISGNAINRRTIDTQLGFYDSSEDTITWDKNSINKFKEINPGDSGSVIFSFSPIPLFSASNGMLSSPSINIDVSVVGKQPLLEYALQDLSIKESSVVKIISDFGFSARALYYSGPLANKGPIPPKAEQETTYTIVWSLSNTSNSISKAKIISSIPNWVTFIGSVSPTGEDLTYNPATREVTWNIGVIPSGTGITGQDREAAFQIKLKPSLSQVNTTPIIINDALLTGHDDFANVDVKVNRGSLNTRLGSDPAFPISGERVEE